MESRLQHSRRQAESRHVRRRHRRDHQGDLTDGRRAPKGCRAWPGHRANASNLPYLPFPPFSLVDSQLQAFFLVLDDMMDLFIPRCWHCVPKVCQITINDSFMLEAAIYYLLKEHFLGRATVLIFWSFSGDDVPDGDGATYRFDLCSARLI